MNISFDLYKVFYYVCEFKSITKAAQFLYVSQPAITKHIKNLESSIGKTLIIRKTKGIELTSDGSKLYNEIKEPVEKFLKTETTFTKKEDECEIRIVAGYSTIKVFLLKTLSKFNTKYPNVKFEIGTYTYYEAIQRLREGRTDLVFLNLKNVKDELNDLVVEKSYEVQDIFVVSKELKDKFPEQINILELNNYPIICKTGSSVARKNIEQLFKEKSLKFIPKYELSNHWLIEEYVNMNLGIGLVTREFVIDELKSGKLVEIKTDHALPKRTIGYVCRKNTSNYHMLKELIDELNKSIEKTVL